MTGVRRLVAYTALNGAAPARTQVVLTTDSGATWTPPQILALPGGAESRGLPSAAWGGGSRFYIAHRGVANDSSCDSASGLYLSTSDNGGSSFDGGSVIRITATEVTTQYTYDRPSLAVDHASGRRPPARRRRRTHAVRRRRLRRRRHRGEVARDPVARQEPDQTTPTLLRKHAGGNGGIVRYPSISLAPGSRRAVIAYLAVLAAGQARVEVMSCSQASAGDVFWDCSSPSPVGPAFEQATTVAVGGVTVPVDLGAVRQRRWMRRRPCRLRGPLGERSRRPLRQGDR